MLRVGLGMAPKQRCEPSFRDPSLEPRFGLAPIPSISGRKRWIHGTGQRWKSELRSEGRPERLVSTWMPNAGEASCQFSPCLLSSPLLELVNLRRVFNAPQPSMAILRAVVDGAPLDWDNSLRVPSL